MNFYVDPNAVTNFNRTEEELELFLMFCCVVAGKTATTQARALEKFLLSLPVPVGMPDSPFNRIATIGVHSQKFLDLLEESKLGQYRKLRQCFIEITSFLRWSLTNCTVEELQSIHGIGPKTARFFLLHSRKDQKLAVLDTHILKYLRDNGVVDAPKSTPGPALYERLEQQFIALAEASGKSIADFDLEIWRKYSGNV